MVATQHIVACLRRLPVQRPSVRRNTVREGCRIVRQVRSKSNLPPWGTANLLAEAVKRFRWCRPLEILLRDLVLVAATQVHELPPRDFARVIWALSLAPMHASSTWDEMLCSIQTRSLRDFSALDRTDILVGLARGPPNVQAREYALRWLLGADSNRSQPTWPKERVSSVLWAFAVLQRDPLALAHGISLAAQVDINRDLTSPAMLGEGSYALAILAPDRLDADQLASQALGLGWPNQFGEQLQANICFALTHKRTADVDGSDLRTDDTLGRTPSSVMEAFLDTIPLLPVRGARHTACVANLCHRYDRHRDALRAHAVTADKLPSMETLALARALAPCDSALTSRLLRARRSFWCPSDALDALVVAAQANLSARDAPRLQERPRREMLGIASWAAAVLGMRDVVYDCVRHRYDMPSKYHGLLCYAAALAHCGTHEEWKELLMLGISAVGATNDRESQTQYAIGCLYAYAVHGILSRHLLYDSGEVPEQSDLHAEVASTLRSCRALRHRTVSVEVSPLPLLAIDIMVY